MLFHLVLLQPVAQSSTWVAAQGATMPGFLAHASSLFSSGSHRNQNTNCHHFSQQPKARNTIHQSDFPICRQVLPKACFPKGMEAAGGKLFHCQNVRTKLNAAARANPEYEDDIDHEHVYHDSDGVTFCRRQPKESVYDHIIIGSGVGGLTVASLLAQVLSTKSRTVKTTRNERKDNEPISILVLEQHYVLGGNTHTWSSRRRRNKVNNEYEFGVGIHYVGDVGDDKYDQAGKQKASKLGVSISRLLKAVTPHDDPIRWKALPDHFDSVLLGKYTEEHLAEHSPMLRRYDIIAKKQAEVLKQQFCKAPHHAAIIDQYFRLVEQAYKSFHRSLTFKMLPKRLVQLLLSLRITKFLDNRFSSKWSRLTVQEVLDSLFLDQSSSKNASDKTLYAKDDDDLRRVLQYSWGDYGTPPDKAPFAMHALLTNHYLNGAYYPRGGPKQITEKFLKGVREAAASIASAAQTKKSRNAVTCTFCTSAPVRRILVENDKNGRERATGVELHNGRRITARQSVVSNAGYINTVSKLLPSNVTFRLTDSSLQKNSSLQNGPTGVCLYVGLKGGAEKYKLPQQQLWMFPDDAPMAKLMASYPDTLEQACKSMKPSDWSPVFVTSPSAKDAKYWKDNHAGRCTLEIISAAPWSWFSDFVDRIPRNADEGHVDMGGHPGSHGPAYEDAKAFLAQSLWSRARQGLIEFGADASLLPVQLSSVDYFDMGTPLTYAHYLYSHQGAFYGLDHDVTRFDAKTYYLDLRPDNVANIQGLFLTGQDVGTCGMAGALLGGYLCATRMLGMHNPFSLLEKVEQYRERNKT